MLKSQSNLSDPSGNSGKQSGWCACMQTLDLRKGPMKIKVKQGSLAYVTPEALVC